MEKSQKEFEEFQNVVRAELLRRLGNGELDEDDLFVLEREKVVDNSASMQ